MPRTFLVRTSCKKRDGASGVAISKEAVECSWKIGSKSSHSREVECYQGCEQCHRTTISRGNKLMDDNEDGRKMTKTGIFMPKQDPRAMLHAVRSADQFQPKTKTFEDEKGYLMKRKIMYPSAASSHLAESSCGCCEGNEKPCYRDEDKRLVQSKEEIARSISKYAKDIIPQSRINDFIPHSSFYSQRRFTIRRPIALLPERCSCPDCRHDGTKGFSNNNEYIRPIKEDLFVKMSKAGREDSYEATGRSYNEDISNIPIREGSVPIREGHVPVSERKLFAQKEEARRGRNSQSEDENVNIQNNYSQYKDLVENGEVSVSGVAQRVWGHQHGHGFPGNGKFRELKKEVPKRKSPVPIDVYPSEIKDERTFYYERGELNPRAKRVSRSEETSSANQIEYPQNCDCDECVSSNHKQIKQEERETETANGFNLRIENADSFKDGVTRKSGAGRKDMGAENRNGFIFSPTKQERALEIWKLERKAKAKEMKMRLEMEYRQEKEIMELQTSEMLELKRKGMLGHNTKGLKYDANGGMVREKDDYDISQNRLSDVAKIAKERENDVEVYQENETDWSVADNDWSSEKRLNAKKEREINDGVCMSDEETMFNEHEPELVANNLVLRHARDKEKRTMLKQTREKDAGKKSRALANWLERKRVAELNDAFERLRKMVPAYGNEDRSLSKIKTLRYASTYINHLAVIHDKQCRYGIEDLKKGLVKFLEMDPLLQRCQEHLETECII